MLDVTVRVSRRELALAADSLCLKFFALGVLYQLARQQANFSLMQTVGEEHTLPRLSWLFSVCAGMVAASVWRR